MFYHLMVTAHTFALMYIQCLFKGLTASLVWARSHLFHHPPLHFPHQPLHRLICPLSAPRKCQLSLKRKLSKSLPVTACATKWNNLKNPNRADFSPPPSRSAPAAALTPRIRRRELYRDIRSHIWGSLGKRQIHGWSTPLANANEVQKRTRLRARSSCI